MLSAFIDFFSSSLTVYTVILEEIKKKTMSFIYSVAIIYHMAIFI